MGSATRPIPAMTVMEERWSIATDLDDELFGVFLKKIAPLLIDQRAVCLNLMLDSESRRTVPILETLNVGPAPPQVIDRKG
jgi:hypothetical protein